MTDADRQQVLQQAQQVQQQQMGAIPNATEENDSGS